jgi:hypothetical protein
VDGKAHTHHRIVNVYIEVNGERAVSEGYGDPVIREHATPEGEVVKASIAGATSTAGACAPGAG